jgi:hemerythrin superfamily protein
MMVATPIDDAKRTLIATQLASMSAIQNLLVENDRLLISIASSDQDVRKRLQKILEADRNSLSVLDTVIEQYGIRAEPAEAVVKLLDTLQQLVSSSSLSLYEKVLQCELLKHQQELIGLTIHKAAQMAGAEVEAAIAPLSKVNADNQAHQEQLKSILEAIGVRELTGQEVEQGLWSRVQETIASLSGLAGNLISQTLSKPSIEVQDAIRADQERISALITEIENCNDAPTVQTCFDQLYRELSNHAEAKRQAVYPELRSLCGEEAVQLLSREQAQMDAMLKQIKTLTPSSYGFKNAVKTLKGILIDHIRQEENTLFPAIHNCCTREQSERLSKAFEEAKQRLQEKTIA